MQFHADYDRRSKPNDPRVMYVVTIYDECECLYIEAPELGITRYLNKVSALKFAFELRRIGYDVKVEKE